MNTTPVLVQAPNLYVLTPSVDIALGANNAPASTSIAYFNYAATDSNNNIHLYSLNLQSSATPTPTQVGSFSVPLPTGQTISTVLCPANPSYTFGGGATGKESSALLNYVSASSGFAVFDVAGSGGCYTAGDSFQLVKLSDGPSTAPVTLSIPNNDFVALYNTSTYALTGLFLYDSANGNINLYPYVSGTQPFSGAPTAVISGVATATVIDSKQSINALRLVDVTLTSAPAVHQLYAISASGATSIYTAQGTLGDVINDGNNVFLVDNSTSGTTQTSKIVQIPEAGGNPTVLYTQTNGPSLSLIGSNRSILVIATTVLNSTTGVTTETFYPLTPGTQYGTTIPATPYFQAAGETPTAKMVQTIPGDPTTSVLLVNWSVYTGTTLTYSYYSAALTPALAYKQPITQHTQILTDGLFGNAVELTGIPDNGVSIDDGGGIANAVNLGATTLAPVPLTYVDGSTYTIPSGYQIGFVYSNQIGGLYSFGTTAGTFQAYDLSKHLIVPILLNGYVIDPLF